MQYSFSTGFHEAADRSRSKWEDLCIESCVKIPMVLDNLNRHGFNCTAF